MKWLRFNEVQHCGSGEFSVDFSSNDFRKFKKPLDGVHVYEDDTFEVLRNGFNDPDWRNRFHKLTGMSMSLLNDFKRCKFSTYEGVPVPRSQIKHDTLLEVPHLGRVYNIGTGGYRVTAGIRFIHPNAMPVARNPIVRHTRNQEKENVIRDRLKDHISLGATLAQVSDSSLRYARSYWGIQREVEAVVRGLKPTSSDLADPLQQMLCLYMGTHAAQVEDLIRDEAKDIDRYEFLMVKG